MSSVSDAASPTVIDLLTGRAAVAEMFVGTLLLAIVTPLFSFLPGFSSSRGRV